ncbi:MAG: SDR family oxidoreductase [Kiritimatiellae bacterium]|nr:SDR family oxidoreductase [Kiritimatiellia bacterium]
MTMNTKVAIITGGAQGIGKAIGRKLLSHGMAIVMADNDKEAGRETLAEFQALGAVRFIAADVASEPQVKKLVAATLKAFGRLDVLVNNAAISANTAPTKLSLADWNRVLAVNLTGAFLCAKHAAPHLNRRQGTIVNIASTRAYMSEPNTEAYSASKGGLVALTHALAMSLGPTIRVNCISPGWIETESSKKTSARCVPVLSAADRQQHPAGRVGTPADIAALVDYLCSDSAGFITAANFMVDGGMTRKMIYV